MPLDDKMLEFDSSMRLVNGVTRYGCTNNVTFSAGEFVAWASSSCPHQKSLLKELSKVVVAEYSAISSALPGHSNCLDSSFTLEGT